MIESKNHIAPECPETDEPIGIPHDPLSGAIIRQARIDKLAWRRIVSK